MSNTIKFKCCNINYFSCLEFVETTTNITFLIQAFEHETMYIHPKQNDHLEDLIIISLMMLHHEIDISSICKQFSHTIKNVLKIVINFNGIEIILRSRDTYDQSIQNYLKKHYELYGNLIDTPTLAEN